MSKMSKAIAVLGVVAGLGVAALPLSSYAASTSDSEQAQIKVEVGGAISLALDKADGSAGTWNETTNTLDLGKIMINADPTIGTIQATVKSNDKIGYELTMYALNNGVMKGDTGGTIPNNAPEKETAGWGYTTETVTDVTNATFTAMPTSADGAATIAQAEAGTGALNATANVTFGVTADEDTPEGIYTGTVVFTATVK